MNGITPISNPQNALPINEPTLPSRIIKAVKEAFLWLKETVILAWRKAVSWIKTSWTVSTFVFFRTFNFFLPETGRKIELGLLYVKDFFNEVIAMQNGNTIQKLYNENTKNLQELKTLQQEVFNLKGTLIKLEATNKTLETKIARMAETKAKFSENETDKDQKIVYLEKTANNLQQQLNLLRQKDQEDPTQLEGGESRFSSQELNLLAECGVFL